MKMYYLGLDLGQAQDFTALCVMEKVRLNKSDKETFHHLRHIQRFELGTTYPAIVEKLQQMVQEEPLIGKYLIIADATGCGRPVINLMHKAKLHVTPVNITGGHRVSYEEGYYNVPKRDLVSMLQVLLGDHRLKIAENLTDAHTLIHELLNFQMTINEKANDIYEGRQGVHDDILLAVALASWFSETYGHVWEPPKERSHSPIADWF
jgi:hypothetical protein